MAAEQIMTNKHYRVMYDLTNKIWHRISFWKKAQDIEFDNGRRLQDTCGAIDGITDSLTSTSSTTAASANAIRQLNDKIVSM